MGSVTKIYLQLRKADLSVSHGMIKLVHFVIIPKSKFFKTKPQL